MVKAEFKGRLAVECLDDTAEQPDLWVLIKPLQVELTWTATPPVTQLLTIPTGFITDFASVPRMPLVYLAVGGMGERAAVVHDYLYGGGLCSRADADAVFRACLIACRVSRWRAWLMWAGVRLAGGRYYGPRPRA